MEGIINVLKPPNMTSHDVVSFLRRTLGQKRIGHGGTLDPQAAGVLPVCVGAATRLAEYVGGQRKSYFCEMTLGKATDTQDAWGKVLEMKSVPFLSLEQIKETAAGFTGKIRQKVPAYSAVKVAGQPLYKAARRGESIEPVYRIVDIHQLEILGYENHKIRFWVECGKGTYIRALCQDLGEALGTTAFMSFLVRTSVGGFTLEEACTLEEIAQYKEKLLLPMEKAVSGLPSLELTDNEVIKISRGQAIDRKKYNDEDIEDLACFSRQGRLVAICRCRKGLISPVKVFNSKN